MSNKQLPSNILSHSRTLSTPHLIVDLEKIRAKYKLLRRLFSFASIFYALKSNPHQKIVKTLDKEGCGFEINSFPELMTISKNHTSPDRIISSGTIKKNSFVREAYEYGVRRFAI